MTWMTWMTGSNIAWYLFMFNFLKTDRFMALETPCTLNVMKTVGAGSEPHGVTRCMTSPAGNAADQINFFF